MKHASSCGISYIFILRTLETKSSVYNKLVLYYVNTDLIMKN